MKSSNGRWGCGSIFGVVLVIAGLLFLVPQFFGGNEDNRDVANDGGDVSSQSVNSDVDLGRLVVAETIDRDGCPVNANSNLDRVVSFYVVATDSEVPEGTDIFVRLYHDDAAIEDLPIITADRDYQNTCINFVFETTDGFAFESGEYEAEFWVNGNAYESTRFLIN